MKKKEILKIQMQLFLIVVIAILIACPVLNWIKTTILRLPTELIIIAFCYILYKTLTKEGI